MGKTKAKKLLAMLLSFAMVIQYGVYTQDWIQYVSADDGEQVQEESAPAPAPAPKQEVKAEPAPAPAPAPAPEPEPEPEPVVQETEADSGYVQETEGTAELSGDSGGGASGEEASVEDAGEGADAAPEGEVPEDAVQDEQQEEENKVTYPAQSFSDSSGGISVSVKAPEGALPEGTKMTVTAIGAGEVMDAVQAAVDGEVSGVRAVDITFTKDGEKIEPKQPVRVVIRASGVDSSADHQELVHIDNGGNASVVSGASVSDSGVAKFTSDQFSYYVIVGVNEEDPALNDVEILSDTTGKGIEVKITGTSDILPEGTQLTVSDISVSKADLSAASGKNITEAQGIRMSLTDADGNAFALTGSVRVEIEGDTATGMVFLNGDYTSPGECGSTYTYSTSSLGEVVFAEESEELRCASSSAATRAARRRPPSRPSARTAARRSAPCRKILSKKDTASTAGS